MTPKQRRSRQEIIETFKACAAELGRTPGVAEFEKRTDIKQSEVKYYWAKYAELARDAGMEANVLQERLDDKIVFRDYARICLSIKKVPSLAEFRIATRELRTQTHTVYTRFSGGIQEFQTRFRSWLQESPTEPGEILSYEGWSAPAKSDDGAEKKLAIQIQPHPGLRPFLPASLQYLHFLAQGERPPYEALDSIIATVFERRTADAFRCLGFEMKQLGQGTGRKADSLALATREHFALIIDAKSRSAGYVLGTEDRKFLEYANKHGRELQQQGFENIYLLVIGPTFR